MPGPAFSPVYRVSRIDRVFLFCGLPPGRTRRRPRLLYYFVTIANLSMFYFQDRTLPGRGRLPVSEKPCKVTPKIRTNQIFNKLFFSRNPNFRTAAGVYTSRASAPRPFRKAGAKLRIPTLTSKFFEHFFQPISAAIKHKTHQTAT